MSSALMQIGFVRLALLHNDGITKQKTLILPPPDGKGGIKLSWRDTGVYEYDLEEGGKAVRAIEKPHIPQLVLTWSPYNDLPDFEGYPPLGILTGQRPTWEQLVELTSARYWGRLRVSPGPPGSNVGGFTTCKVESAVCSIVKGTGLCEQMQLTFHGRDGQIFKSLSEF